MHTDFLDKGATTAAVGGYVRVLVQPFIVSSSSALEIVVLNTRVGLCVLSVVQAFRSFTVHVQAMC